MTARWEHFSPDPVSLISGVSDPALHSIRVYALRFAIGESLISLTWGNEHNGFSLTLLTALTGRAA